MDVEFISLHDSTFSIRVGDKVSAPTYYQGIAQLEVDGVMYIGLSQYWEPLPAEQVLMVRRINKTKRNVADATVDQLFDLVDKGPDHIPSEIMAQVSTLITALQNFSAAQSKL